MIQIAIDTSVLIGLLDPADIWHQKAMALKEALVAHDASIAVFDCVLAEAVSTMALRIQQIGNSYSAMNYIENGTAES